MLFLLDRSGSVAEKVEEGSEYMKNYFLTLIFVFFSISLFSQDSVAKINCRVLAPEEFPGVGYIISHDELIDGAFVEVTNLSNMKKSTAVVSRSRSALKEGVMSIMLATNLGVTFNGEAEVAVRYISFLKDKKDVYTPFLTEEQVDQEALQRQLAEEKQKQEAAAVSQDQLPTPVVEKPTSNEIEKSLPVPRWQFPTEEQLVLDERPEEPQAEKDSQWDLNALPDPNLFKMNYVAERALQPEEESQFQTSLPEVDIDQPITVAEEPHRNTQTPYQRHVETLPEWSRQLHTESLMPRPKDVEVLVNGERLGLSHYPEIECESYEVINDKAQVKKINPFFQLASMDLPQRVMGTGIEDPISREESYSRDYLAEPQFVEVVVKLPEEEFPPVKEETVVVEKPEEVTEENFAPIIQIPEKPHSPLISGALYMQAGAYRQKESAEKVASRIGEIFPTVVFEHNENGEKIYKIAVGPISVDEIGVTRLYLKSFKIKGAFPIIGR